MITVLIVDNQHAVRQGLRLRLGLESDIQVIGEANDGLQAFKLTQALHPDVVVMDLELPELDGLSMTRRLSEAGLSSAVVILTLHDNQTTQTRALAAGAVAFVTKQAGDEALLAAIRQAATIAEKYPKPTGDNHRQELR